MFWRYLWRNISRNRTRTFLVSVGIIISITLITGINISSNQLGTFRIVQSLDEVKVDFRINSETQNLPPIKEELENLQELDSEIEDFLGLFASSYLRSSEMVIDEHPHLNWSRYLNGSEEEREENFRTVHFCGLNYNIFNDPNLETRFEDVLGVSDPLSFNESGIYLDRTTATRLNLSIGDFLNLGTLRQDYIPVGEEYVQVNYTAQVDQIPISGIFEIRDKQSFLNIFSEWNYYNELDGFIMGNITYLYQDLHQNIINQLETKMGENYWNYNDISFSYGVFIDHTELAQSNPNSISQKVQQINTQIQLKVTNKEINSNLLNTINMVRFFIIFFQAIFIIVAIPVLILGWYLSKTNWVLSYQRRRRELALLKVKGGIQSQLKTMFFFEAVFVGLLGGLLGIIGGNLSSYFVLKQVYPQAVEMMEEGNFLLNMLSGKYIQTSTWILGGIMGLAISLLSVWKPLKEFAGLDPIEGLAKYHEATHKELPKKKLDWVLLFLGIIPIANALITQGIIAVNDEFFYNPFLILLSSLGTSFLPLAPFALVYSVIRLLCRNKKIFQSIISWISRLYNKSISVFTAKSIIRNQARSFRLVFIIGMSLSFMTMATTIEGSEIHYQEQIHTIETGDGLPIYYSSQSMMETGVAPIMKELWKNQSTLQFEAFNFAYRHQGVELTSEIGGGGGIPEDYFYYSSHPIYSVSAENFSQYMNLKDKWFEGLSAIEALSLLQNSPNSTLIPLSMEEEGYRVGNKISITYQVNETATKEMELEIVGVYRAFPLVSERYFSEDALIINNGTISSAFAYSIDFTFYAPQNQDQIDPNPIIDFIKGYDPIGYAEVSYIQSEEQDLITTSLLRFLNLESIYLLTIVSFGLAIIMYISVNEKSRDLGLLRARGVPKKIIYKIQIAEGFTLLLMGSFFAFIGILGGAAMMLQINTLNQISGTLVSRTLYLQWGKIMLQIIGSLVLFVGSIWIAVAIETRKSNVSNISDLLRVNA